MPLTNVDVCVISIDHLAKALDSSKPFVKRSVGPDARMLLIANRILPGAGLHHMTRLILGIPRFGGLTNESDKDA